MRFVISNALLPEGMQMLEEMGAEVYVADSTDPHTYIDEIRKADALILRQGDFRRDLIEQCLNLKVIGVTGAGFDNVDVKAASEYGIPVVIAPGANQHSVTEQVFACILLFAKNIVRQDQEIRKGNWEYRDPGKGNEIFEKTLGIIGLGKIGRNVAAAGKAFGMKVIGYDVLGQKAADAAGCGCCASLDELLKQSDYVTIHCVLTEETKGLIGERELKLMKPNAVLINCARGPIVDEQALADALNSGEIAGAAADVYAVEPAGPDNPLFSAKNMILTPHTSGIAREALSRLCTMCVTGCAAVLRGEEHPAVADPEVYRNPKFRERA